MNMNQKTQRRKRKLSNLETTCQQYGVDCYYDEFCLNFEFKDGKVLFYAIPYPYDSTQSLDDLMEELIVKKHIHGRVFRKEGCKFIGYAPEAGSLAEILIAVDLML